MFHGNWKSRDGRNKKEIKSNIFITLKKSIFVSNAYWREKTLTGRRKVGSRTGKITRHEQTVPC